MAIQNVGKSAMRVGKNYIKGYTDTQVKVRQATSNDAWGPSGQLMSEIAERSYNQNDFIEIMEILDKRLNDKGRNWRHVFKSLTLIDYLVHSGSENCILYFRDNIYVIKTLREFQHVDEDGKDQGANVRQKAKDVTNLLSDDARLRSERAGRSTMRDRMLERDSSFNDSLSPSAPAPRLDPGSARRRKEDEDLQRAIEESKRSYRQNEDRIRAQYDDEEELQRALELSRQEEEARIKELELSNRNALFDDSVAEPLVDLNGSQNVSMQPQYTSFNQYLQQQQTGWNPFLQQQMQEQAALQAQWQQQQAEQQRQWELQQAAQQYQALMMGQGQQQSMQPIQPQVTAVGSNNPFAAQPQAPPAQPQPQPQQPAFVPVPQPQPIQAAPPQPAPSTTPAPASQPPPTRVDQSGKFDDLNRLLATGDGVDTFGNTGDQRLGHGGGRTHLMQQHNAEMGQQAFQNAFGSSQPAPSHAQQPEQPFFQL